MTFDWHKRRHGDMIEIASTISLEDNGALNLILDHMHLHGRPLVDDDRRIAGLIGTRTLKWQAIRRRLIRAGALIVACGKLNSPLATSARSQMDLARENKRAAQEKSVEARKNKHLEIAEERRGDKKEGGGLSNGNGERADKPQAGARQYPWEGADGRWRIPHGCKAYAKWHAYLKRQNSPGVYSFSPNMPADHVAIAEAEWPPS